MNFPTTQWSLIATATINGDREGRDALNELCRRYRAPVLAFFRSKSLTVEDAEDLTQALFRKMLENRTWMRADAARGRFRNYLMAIAFNALRSWNKVAHAAKRGGSAGTVSLDFLNDAGWEPQAPDDGVALEFDREWACSVMSGAWRHLEASASATPEKAARFAVLRRFLPGSEAPPSYETAAAELGTSLDNVRTLIFRLRDDFRGALRREVEDTLMESGDIEDEMAHLRKIMTASHGAGLNRTTDILKHSGSDGLMRG